MTPGFLFSGVRPWPPTRPPPPARRPPRRGLHSSTFRLIVSTVVAYAGWSWSFGDKNASGCGEKWTSVKPLPPRRPKPPGRQGTSRSAPRARAKSPATSSTRVSSPRVFRVKWHPMTMTWRALCGRPGLEFHQLPAQQLHRRRRRRRRRRHRRRRCCRQVRHGWRWHTAPAAAPRLVLLRTRTRSSLGGSRLHWPPRFP